MIFIKVALSYMLMLIASGAFYHFHKHVSDENWNAAWVYLIWWQLLLIVAILVPWMGA